LSAPTRLQPVEDASPAAVAPAATAAPARGGYLSRTPTQSHSGIQVDRLGAVEHDAAGVLSSGDGGLGGRLWQGSRYAFVNRLLAAQPEAVASQMLRDLLRRMLLSA
ncbi:MAG: hypothetical protein VW405_10265, partial [Rhodospirillaceae bacterium]